MPNMPGFTPQPLRAGRPTRSTICRSPAPRPSFHFVRLGLTGDALDAAMAKALPAALEAALGGGGTVH